MKDLKTSPMPRVGDHLGDYVLKEVLGKGGMGTVFKARVSSSEELVAVKVLRSTTDETRLRRFQREGEILRQVEHPHLIRVHASGRHGDHPWYAMDYVVGTDLGTLLREHRLSPKQALAVLEQVCEGVAHLHAQGVVHRDLKPENVLVTAEQRAVLIDFGLAKEDQPDPLQGGVTRDESEAPGTPMFMSPEQVRDPLEVDPRSDVWSLGVILYLILTDRVPFAARTAGQVASKILNDELVPPGKLALMAPPDLESITLRALEKDKERRYAHAGELLQELVRQRKGLPVEGHQERETVFTRLARLWAGSKLGAQLATLLWILAVATIVVLHLQGVQFPGE